MGAVFVLTIFAGVCCTAIVRPHVGVIGYYGFALLQPQWNWRWSLPPDFPFQKWIVATTLIGWALTGFSGNEFQGRVKTACGALLCFLGLAYLSSLGTINTARSAFYMGVMWKLVLMAIVAVKLLNTPQKIMAALWAIAIAQGYNAYQINIQYFQDGFSAYATGGWGGQGDNNGYSNVTIPVMAISASLAIYSTHIWAKSIASGIFVLQLHQLMLLESRGAMLGVLAMSIVFVYIAPKDVLKIRWIAATGAIVAVLAGPPVVREFSSIFKERNELDASSVSRFYLWDAGIRITVDHPWLGAGPDAGRFLVPIYYEGERINSSQKALHNLFLEISTGVGIPATVAYLVYFFTPAWLGYKGLRSVRQNEQPPPWFSCVSLAVTSGIVGYWVASAFSSGALLEASYASASAGLAAIAVSQRFESGQASIQPRDHARLGNDFCTTKEAMDP